jgi:hypothetical protein
MHEGHGKVNSLIVLPRGCVLGAKRGNAERQDRKEVFSFLGLYLLAGQTTLGMPAPIQSNS